jgi:hypothetical protein
MVDEKVEENDQRNAPNLQLDLGPIELNRLEHNGLKHLKRLSGLHSRKLGPEILARRPHFLPIPTGKLGFFSLSGISFGEDSRSSEGLI